MLPTSCTQKSPPEDNMPNAPVMRFKESRNIFRWDRLPRSVSFDSVESCAFSCLCVPVFICNWSVQSKVLSQPDWRVWGSNICIFTWRRCGCLIESMADIIYIVLCRLSYYLNQNVYINIKQLSAGIYDLWSHASVPNIAINQSEFIIRGCLLWHKIDTR